MLRRPVCAGRCLFRVCESRSRALRIGQDGADAVFPPFLMPRSTRRIMSHTVGTR
jgi:hypothetical protein